MQLVILYGPLGSPRVYATAYDNEETKRQVSLCVEKRGSAANVRSIDSTKVPLDSVTTD